jgi:hypothetical protein
MSAVVAEGVAADGVEIEALGRGGSAVDGVVMGSLAILRIAACVETVITEGVDGVTASELEFEVGTSTREGVGIGGDEGAPDPDTCFIPNFN